MKNKLHKKNTPCHAELVTEPSRSAASYPVCHSVGVSINKTPIFQIPKFPNFKIILFSIFLILFSIPTTAQPYQWQWAMNGGSNVLSWAGTSWNCYVEQVHDIAIDKNNNYYFVASITTGGTPLLNGQPVTVYGNPNAGNDILLFSTTCNGTLRWSQAIGGGQL